MSINGSKFGTVTALLLLVFFSGAAVDQQRQVILPDKPIKNIVVSIRSVRQDNQVKNGFGFVIGLRGRDPVIATANHILRAPNNEQQPKSITVRYVFFEGKPFEAKALSLYDRTNDIGLIVAATPDGSEKLSKLEPADCPSKLRPGDNLWYVGRDGDWYIPTDPSRFKGIDRYGRILLENSDATEGSSGAPLVTNNGVLGMIVSGQGAGSATAASIEDIRRLVDQKRILQDGTLVDKAWLQKEWDGMDCEKCKRWRAQRVPETQQLCARFKESYCAQLRDQGFPTYKTTYRLELEMERSCNCIPEGGNFRPNPPDSFHEFDGREVAQWSCTSTALRELFTRRMLVSGPFAPILDKFRPTELDFRTIFHGSHVEMAQRAYADEVKASSGEFLEIGLDPGLVHMPECFLWPAGLGRSLPQNRLLGRSLLPPLVIQPRQSVIYCVVVFDNPIRRGEQHRYPGFFYVNGRWVWMYDLDNWGQ
jgi:hypothetical protein